MIKEISNGPVYANEVDLIELNIDNPAFLTEHEVNLPFLKDLKSLGTKFSIHGPYNSYPNEAKNLEVMRRSFAIAADLDAKFMVFHCDVVKGDYRDAMLKAVDSLKKYCRLASDFSVTLLMENMVREKSNDRIGVLPREVLMVVEMVNEDNLKVCLDVGHANLSANHYDFDLLDFVKILRPYICHLHIHDNKGVPPVVDEALGDQHLPVGKGTIDYPKVLGALSGSPVRGIVLELLPSSSPRPDALESISIVRELVRGNVV